MANVHKDADLALSLAEMEMISPPAAPPGGAVPPPGAAPAARVSGPYSAWNNALCGPGKRYSSQCGCRSACVGMLILLFGLVVILPLSVVHVKIDEYGLPKRRTTSVVLSDSPSDVWKNGPQWAGPDWGYQEIPARVEMEKIIMEPFVKGSGNELPVQFQLFWRQDPAFIHTNFRRFGDHTAVRTRLVTQLEVAVKGLSASTFTQTDYVVNLEKVRQGYIDVIKSTLNRENIGVIIHGLYFIKVELPDQVIQSSLQSAILTESEVIKRIEGQSILTRAETAKMVREIQAQTKLLETQGTAESAAIVKVAEAEAAAIISGAEGRGLARFFGALNVTSLESKAKWQRYLAILRKTDP